MPGRRKRTRFVAVRLEADLVAVLNRLPDRSAVIRRAILALCDVPCPLCGGTGVVLKEVRDLYAPLLTAAPPRT
jgi:hypothetical protein